MAEELDDGEFWLPSEFLADDIVMEKARSRGEIDNRDGFSFPCDFPYGFAESFGSALSSPVESVVGSTETESDEEDYMAGLNRKMAHCCMLQDTQKISPPAFCNDNPKTRVMATSPQSTLCAFGCCSGRGDASSRGSLNAQSQLPSPPSKPVERKDQSWDFLNRATGHVVMMKTMNKGTKFCSQGLLNAPSIQAAPVKSTPVGFYPTQALTQQQLQNVRFQELKQQQLLKQQSSAAWARQGKAMPTPQQQLQTRSRAVGFYDGRYARPLGLSSSAWPPLQQQQQQPHRQADSGMRAVFLGNSSSKRESSGTGVFLPRGAGNPSEPRKKPACSSVLLPARVVQALNLNLDEMGTAHPRFQGGCLRDYEPVAVPRSNSSNNNLISQQRRSNNSIRYHPTTNQENLLPQEWTY